MQQQKELYQSKYETLLNVAQLGGWEYDALTQELYCNKSYFSMLGRLDATMNDWDKYSIKEVWKTGYIRMTCRKPKAILCYH